MLKKMMIYLIGNLGSKILSFIMVPIYTSVLLPSDFGLYDYWGTIAGLISTVVGMQIFRIIYTDLLKHKEEKNKKETIAIAIQFLIIQIALTVVFGGIIYGIIPDYAIYITLIILFTIVLEYLSHIVRGIEKTGVMAIAGVIQTGITLLSTILIIYSAIEIDNVSILFIGQLLGAIAATVFYLICLLKMQIFQGLKFQIYDKQKYISLLILSLPLVPSTISWWIMNVSDRFLIINYLSESSNGLYAMAYKFPSLLAMINMILAMVWQDQTILTNNSPEKSIYYTRKLKQYINIQFFSVIIFIIIFKFIAPIFLYGEFTNAINYVPILALAVVFSGVSGYYGAFYLSTNRTNGAFYTSVYGAIANVVLNIIFIPVLGLYAAALSTVISFVIMSFIRAIEFKKQLDIKIPWVSIVSWTIIFVTTYILLYFQS